MPPEPRPGHHGGTPEGRGADGEPRPPRTDARHGDDRDDHRPGQARGVDRDREPRAEQAERPPAPVRGHHVERRGARHRLEAVLRADPRHDRDAREDRHEDSGGDRRESAAPETAARGEVDHRRDQRGGHGFPLAGVEEPVVGVEVAGGPVVQLRGDVRRVHRGLPAHRDGHGVPVRDRRFLAGDHTLSRGRGRQPQEPSGGQGVQQDHHDEVPAHLGRESAHLARRVPRRPAVRGGARRRCRCRAGDGHRLHAPWCHGTTACRNPCRSLRAPTATRRLGDWALPRRGRPATLGPCATAVSPLAGARTGRPRL